MPHSGLDPLHILIALSLAPPSIRRAVCETLRAGGQPRAALLALANCAELVDKAAAAVGRAGETGLRAVAWTDPDYPALLAAVFDPPLVLWVRGCVAALHRPAVAVVGSRAGSPYALAVGEQLGHDLAARGVVVTSGLARGVDSAAHRGALAAHGTTIAVLGCGADLIYPPEHAVLAASIVERGAVVSELLPGTVPQPFFFPLRNRIISGLSRAVVVIEAGEKSGSLITARCALDQGRDVLAVPGNVLNGRNRGGHALLKDGAKIVETADDILEELGLVGAAGVNRPGTAEASKVAGGQRAADPVLASFSPGEPFDLDALAERSGLTVPRLLPRLFELELRGLIRRAGGGRFVLI